ncbi:hypothetical protein BJX96DRAFT_170717 [Aspergillus floccosus]
MRFLWTATLIVGCLGAPLTPPFSKMAESMEGMTQNGDVAVCILRDPMGSITLQLTRGIVACSSLFWQCKTKRESPTMTTDGDVNPTNDGTVNNNVSFLRFC